MVIGKKKKPKVSAATLHEALRQRFAPPEWAYFDEVRDATGYGHRRTADAVAMNLWPVRGLELHGVEIKSDRRDWLNEKDTPAKADAVGRYCDRWWLAIGDTSVAQLDEVPAPWGLLVFQDGGLTCVRKASKLPEPVPLDRHLLAALLRKASTSCTDHIHKNEVAKHAEAEIAAARAGGLSEGRYEGQRALQAHAQLLDAITSFEKASGVRIDVFNGRRIGDAVRILTEIGLERLAQQAEWTRNQATTLAKLADQLATDLVAVIGKGEP